MKYRNNITNKISEHKYRFKTLEEFINQYTEDWKETVNWNDEDRMDYLFGQNLEVNEKELEKIFKGDFCAIPRQDEDDSEWYINGKMIKENEPQRFKDMYLKDKQNVYENKILKFKEYKKGDF